MSLPIITLTTDFGADSPYLAQMKASILAVNPDARMVDITHSVPPQDVRHGAVVLDQVGRWFPHETIHLAVVDPGVGTEREILCATIGTQHYVAPDNGLLSALTRNERPTQLVTLTNRQYWRNEVSSTFHGRDVMAPVAGHLSLSVPLHQLGEPRDTIVRLEWPEVQVAEHSITGSVLIVDSFGNLITDVTAQMLSLADRDGMCVRCGEHQVIGLVQTYGQRSNGELVALVGSSGLLEIAVVGGNAASLTGCRAADRVSISW